MSDLYVKHDDQHKRVLFLVKELLKERNDINVISGYLGASTVSRVCSTLVNLNYASYSGIQTRTEVNNGKRRTSLIVKIAKTKDFDKLYADNLEKRKKYQEEREKLTNTNTPSTTNK